MKTRDQIIAEIVRQYEKEDRLGDEALGEEQGQAFVDDLQSRREAYPSIVSAELQKRLTEEIYLTCDDFDHFDVNCCDTCHTCHPHHEMWIVVLSDGRHAWLCDSIEQILMRRAKVVPSSPEKEQMLALLADIFGGSKADPVEDDLHASSIAATTDKEKLYYCIKYAHHVHGRKRCYQSVEDLVGEALCLPGRGLRNIQRRRDLNDKQQTVGMAGGNWGGDRKTIWAFMLWHWATFGKRTVPSLVGPAAVLDRV